MREKNRKENDDKYNVNLQKKVKNSIKPEKNPKILKNG